MEPEVVSFSAVIDACGRAGHTDRARRIFDRLLALGVRPTIVTYTSLARPFARRGDFEKVEQIHADALASGVTPNEYFLNVQLSAYTHALPPQPARAEAALREALGRGIKLNEFVVTSLERCVGEARFADLQAELGLGAPKPRPVRPRESVNAAGKACHRGLPHHRR